MNAPTPAPKSSGIGRVLLIGAAVTLGFGFLRYINYSPTQVVARATAPAAAGERFDACLTEYRVYGAGTDQALRWGHVFCQHHVDGKTEASGTRVECVLDGIADVRTEAGLRMLVVSCKV